MIDEDVRMNALDRRNEDELTNKKGTEIEFERNKEENAVLEL